MPSIWAIADLHLSFGTPNKEMDIFGVRWVRHAERLKENWTRIVKPEDLVLIPGDISWGMTPEAAKPDLEWIHALPGTKVMVKGNHDYWWTSLKKLENILPPSIHLIQNNSFTWNSIGFAGTRLWDNIQFNFDSYIDYSPRLTENIAKEEDHPEETQKIYHRELLRLENSLKALSKNCTYRIALVHYPPVSPILQESPASSLLEKYQINACVFGHIHSMKQDRPIFGVLNHINYIFTACDYLNCTPTLVHTLD